MELFHRYHEEPNLDTRPARLPSTVPPELRLFAELTSMPRRKSTVPKSTTKADEWRNSGGKNACVCFEVQPELIFDGEGDGLFLARRIGKLKRDGEVDLTYHQFNIDRTARPGSRGGQVTIYHILPLQQANRKQQGLGLELRGAPLSNYSDSNSGSLHDVYESEESIDETAIDVRDDETVIDGRPRIRCHCTPGPGWRIQFRCRACPAPYKTRSKDGAIVHGRACTGALDMVRA
jgi:hypothetical protein